jgi:hypothetical protein
MPAFEYLSRVLPRKSVPKLDNSRHLEVREFLGEKIPNLLHSEHCLAVGLHRSNKRLPELGIRDAEDCTIGDARHADQYLFDFGGINIHPAR